MSRSRVIGVDDDSDASACLHNSVDARVLAALDHRCDPVHRRERHYVVHGHLREHTIATIGLVQMRVVTEINEALGVAAVGHVPMRHATCSPPV